jgi:hypothetical protein
MSDKFDLIFQTSGLLEKYGCTLQDIKYTFHLFCNTMWDKETRARLNAENDPEQAEHFINTLFLMGGDIEDIKTMYERNVRENEEYYFDIQVKKSAGTYDEWFKEITKQTDEAWPHIERFFKDFDQKLVNRNKRLN